jgi:AraC-like DNA-binding protein
MEVVKPLYGAHTPRFDPQMLRAHRLFESHDLDETRDRISRVMQPHRLLPLAGAQNGQAGMEFVRVGGIGAGTIRFNGRMRVDVEAVEDYHLLMFCTRGTADVHVNERVLQADTARGVLCAPGARFRADLSHDCEQFVLRLDRATVEAHAGGPVVFDEVLDLRRPALAAWQAQLGLLLESSALLEAVQARPVLTAEMERLVLHLLLDGQHWARGQRTADRGSASPSISPHGRSVKRAESYIHAHLEEPLRLSDIAQACGVSARTLLSAFQQERACSPMQRVQQLRLELSRRLLRDARPGQTVASIALDCGFTHLGRFAHAYRQCFGESPSATLRQGR